MDRQTRFEKFKKDEHFVRRIDHDTGLIDSICLHCFATVCSATDTAVNARSEISHACVPRQKATAGHPS